MVLLAELVLAAGVLAGVWRLATRPGEGMAAVEPDRSPASRADGPLTADELVALRIPAGIGYRKVDVDRLLDRLARQLPRSTYAPGGADDGRAATPSPPHPSISLRKEPNRG
jgi:hypothetical protein